MYFIQHLLEKAAGLKKTCDVTEGETGRLEENRAACYISMNILMILYFTSSGYKSSFLKSSLFSAAL